MVSKVKRIDTYWRCNNPPKCFYFWSWNGASPVLLCSARNMEVIAKLSWCYRMMQEIESTNNTYRQKIYSTDAKQMQSTCQEHSGSSIEHCVFSRSLWRTLRVAAGQNWKSRNDSSHPKLFIPQKNDWFTQVTTEVGLNCEFPCNVRICALKIHVGHFCLNASDVMCPPSCFKKPITSHNCCASGNWAFASRCLCKKPQTTKTQTV